MSSVVRKDDGSRYVNSNQPPRDRLAREIMYDRIRSGLSQGMSDSDTALYADCCTKTVLRYRHRHNIPAQVFGGRSRLS